MGDIADMMLDGTLCEQCGEFIGEPCGYSILCKDCADWVKKEGVDDE